MTEYMIRRRKPHPKQADIISSPAARVIVRAGRRSGKTTYAAMRAIDAFLQGRRVLYATPTIDQIDRFWHEVKRAFEAPLDAGMLYKHEGLHVISFPDIVKRIEDARGDAIPGEEARIRAKTAWNADSLRGDFADLLILDEWQLMDEETWGRVGAPMLLDNNGDAVFIYTPPSLRSRSASKARDPLHAAKRFKEYHRQMEEGDVRYAAFHFTSHDNPYLDPDALEEIAEDMTALAYRQEIEAEDVEDNPGALWKRAWLEAGRVAAAPTLDVIAVGVDPTGTEAGDACGIVVGGRGKRGRADHLYFLADDSLHGTPDAWAKVVVAAYDEWEADVVVAEANFGGQMVEHTIHSVEGGASVPVKLVHASRGKRVRAEPVSVLFEKKTAHVVGSLPLLEDEMCLWEPGMASPNRMDAAVWVGTELMIEGRKRPARSMRR